MSDHRDDVYPGPNNPDLFEEGHHITTDTKYSTGRTQRLTGFYWCKMGLNGPWLPCYWNIFDGYWLVPGRHRPFVDDYFTAIDERPLVRQA